MYSLQNFTPSVSSSALTWHHQSNGWNISSPPTRSPERPFEASAIIDINVSTQNGIFFEPHNVTVSLGAFLRFHIPHENCSLIRAYSDICVNASKNSSQEKLQVLEAVNLNGSAILDYNVDSDVPQWLYPSHLPPQSLCEAGTVFTIILESGSGTAENSTLNQDSPFSLPTSTSHAHGACDGPSAATTTQVGESSSSTGIRTNASASRTSQQPFETSFAPELSNHGRKVMAHYRFAIFSALLLGHFLCMLSDC